MAAVSAALSLTAKKGWRAGRLTYEVIEDRMKLRAERERTGE